MKSIRVVLVSMFAVALFSGCIATRKFTRNEVKTSSDQLTGQIDKTNAEVKSTQDSVTAVNQRVTTADQKITGVDTRVTVVDNRVSGVDQKVTGVDSRLGELDKRTTQGMNSLRADLTAANAKADATAREHAALETRFKNRNTYEISIQKAVQFRFDSAELPAGAKEPLDEVAKFLQDNPEAIVVLEGHTDNSGDAAYNRQLGERRVEVIRRYLAVEKGVPVYRMEQISFGADRPLTSNDTRAGREQNRAVSLQVLLPLSAGASASN
jgi:outer membrane protein OmpA-like peptidoglycan-associated protein